MKANEEDSSSGNKGSKSRFGERLKKIARQKKRKPRNLSYKKGNKIDVRIIFKPFLIVSAFLWGAVNDETKKRDKNIDVSQSEITSNNSANDNTICFNDENNKKRLGLKSNLNYRKNVVQKNLIINENNVKSFEVSNNSSYQVGNMKDKLDIYEQEVVSNVVPSNNFDNHTNFHSSGYVNQNNFKIKELQRDIISSIKKRLLKTSNELEMLNSEFYILKEITNDDVYLAECQEKIKETKKLLSKIKSLKEKYDYLKNNADFDNLINLEDGSLVDKIIELKNISTNDETKVTIDNYKILEEYKSLYLKIDLLEEDVLKYNKYKEEKELELKKRDIDFGKLKNETYNKIYEQRRYDNFVEEQNMILKNLNEKLMKIDSREIVTYKLNGFNQLIGNSFKYLGLLMASPLKGIFPGIATQTIVTRNIINNLYNNLEWEQEKKIVYETIDFASSINTAINDLEHTLNLVNLSINDIKRLKEKYINDFSKYSSSSIEYNEVIKKINKIENSLLNNKIKIQLIHEGMKEKEKENDKKMKMVKKLNCSSNN